MAGAATATVAAGTTDWPYKKVTLIKPLVGRVRTPSFPLPASPSHVYGARIQKDNETTATLLHNWTTTATPSTAAGPHSCNANSEGKKVPQSWVRTNILALKHGNLTARTQREFAKRHPVTVPLKRVIGGGTDQHTGGGAGGAPESSPRAKALAASGFVFRLATPRNAETLGEVIGGRFAPCLLEPEPDYPRGIVAVLAARMPKPHATRSSKLLKATHAEQIRQRREQEEAARTGVPVGGKLWTMPRWAKVQSKAVPAA